MGEPRVATAPNLFRLEGSTVLVTGAGRGLGRGIGLAAAAAGAKVVAVARSADELEKTATLGEALGADVVPIRWDVSDVGRTDELVAQAEEALGPIDAVVHAAGVQHRAAAQDITVEAWRKVLSVNLDAPFFLSCAVHRRALAQERSSSHLFIGSLTATIGRPDLAAYAASKGAIETLVRTLAVEWAPTGTRVNGLVPGYFETKLTEDLLADRDRAIAILSRIPLGRLGQPEDLAGAAVFLLSRSAEYVTGQMLGVDGGWLAG